MAYTKPYSELITAALLARVTQVDFLHVTYPEAGACISLGEPVQCKSARTGPLSASWGEATKSRLSGRPRERTEWRWELILVFDQEVNTEDFEASVSENPPRVVRDTDHDRQVDLFLETANYSHPVQNQPASGTEATFVFNAVLTPV